MTLPTVIGLDRAIVIGAGATASGFILTFPAPGGSIQAPRAPLNRDRVALRGSPPCREKLGGNTTMNHIAVIPGLVTVTLITVVAWVLAWLNHRNHRNHREPPKPRASRSSRKASTRTPRARAPVPSRSRKSRGARS